MDEERPQVFDEEDGAPCYLWAEVFYIDGALVAETGRVEEEGIRGWDVGAVAAFGYAETVDRGAGS